MKTLKDKKDFAGFTDSKGLFKDYPQGSSGRDILFFNSVFLGVVAVVFALCIITS